MKISDALRLAGPEEIDEELAGMAEDADENEESEASSDAKDDDDEDEEELAVDVDEIPVSAEFSPKEQALLARFGYNENGTRNERAHKLATALASKGWTSDDVQAASLIMAKKADSHSKHPCPKGQWWSAKAGRCLPRGR